ncbi:MAG: diguanylate cyclase [Amycolatopsis sp.]|uniref:GGDEF domain-containing protein n=1 Tax=Amycolatopsis sp. TaxID=37632 RepID=UPI0026019774|nr:GGDEF domain-containing protein [Amycolatopsis sp.]MCU1686657.1 diguanylate cyclase [Amycolatopsis sp.]
MLFSRARTSLPSAPRRLDGLDPRRWPLWSLSRPVLMYLGLVEIAAAVAATMTATLVPITSQALIWCALLIVAELGHLEAARGIERIRELGADGSPHMHLQSIWIFAALLLVPPPLVLLVIVISYGHSWVRVYRRRSVLHRKVFSAATVVLACTCAYTVLYAGTAGQVPFMARLDGFSGMVTLILAGFVYFGVNYAMVVAMILVTNPANPGRQALGNVSDILIVGAAVGLGCGVALVMTVRPWLLPVLMITPLALQLGLLLPQLRAASRTDSKTGLITLGFWDEVAQRELLRARRLASTVGVLMIDIDHFKRINDQRGHLAGDEVLRAVATAIRGQVRAEDFVGRYGGEEFVVLLPGVTGAEAAKVAERVRLGIKALAVDVPAKDLGEPPVTVRGLGASIGVAAYPQHATELGDLLQAADVALYEAKETGRGKVVESSRPLPPGITASR